MRRAPWVLRPRGSAWTFGGTWHWLIAAIRWQPGLSFLPAGDLLRVRILLTHHFPIAHSPVGNYVAELARTLREAEHEVRVIAIGGLPRTEDLLLRTVECEQAGSKFKLPFDVPWFGVEPDGPLTFEDLSTEQLATYRDVLRNELDVEVDSFDPQIIHAQYAWIWGQLALETGVPYVLSAWGPELVTRARDDRYRMLADQAAENAGRIFVPDEHVRGEVLRSFEDVAERTLLMPAEADRDLAVMIAGHYQAVLDERFGRAQ